MYHIVNSLSTYVCITLICTCTCLYCCLVNTPFSMVHTSMYALLKVRPLTPSPFRLWTVRFYSYFSLLIAVTTEIECTQPPSQQTGGQCSISFSIQDVANPVANPTADGPCPIVSVDSFLSTALHAYMWAFTRGSQTNFNAV